MINHRRKIFYYSFALTQISKHSVYGCICMCASALKQHVKQHAIHNVNECNM